MCRAVLESEADTSQAKGVNNGIIYLMAIPYLLVAITGFYIYKIFNKKSEVKKT
jgi:heme/copper-type cytochrome/quinol oxidase subunit 2